MEKFAKCIGTRLYGEDLMVGETWWIRDTGGGIFQAKIIEFDRQLVCLDISIHDSPVPKWYEITSITWIQTAK